MSRMPRREHDMRKYASSNPESEMSSSEHYVDYICKDQSIKHDFIHRLSTSCSVPRYHFTPFIRCRETSFYALFQGSGEGY